MHLLLRELMQNHSLPPCCTNVFYVRNTGVLLSFQNLGAGQTGQKTVVLITCNAPSSFNFPSFSSFSQYFQ